MRSDDLEARMRGFEADAPLMPNVWLVARVDGRSFTRLTKEVHAFERPFDVRFRDHMLATTAHLMECGFTVRYAYTQSDEISLLMARDEGAFGRKLRKLCSV